MQPFPAPKSVIVMDNARIHKDPRVLDLITSRYAQSLSYPRSIIQIPVVECAIFSYHPIHLIIIPSNLDFPLSKLLFDARERLSGRPFTQL
ncbi:hypothetical protein F5879DRAFT_40703 [Lentinula edodes]|nr:hypothetical protein F5879DRAFT_40703 [Lentinula edodes]